jgi:hypothetical protein
VGTRANILVDHRVPDHLDRAVVIDRLAPTVPATIAVRDYWDSSDPDERRDQSTCWTASPEFPPPHEKFVMYDGPGGFFIRLGSKVAVVRASARWHGFLSIEPLRRAHLPAFRAIARALGASRVVYLGDDDPITDAAEYDGASLDACIAEMERRWWPPQPSIESIAPDVVKATDHRVPSVWYIETIEEKRGDIAPFPSEEKRGT